MYDDRIDFTFYVDSNKYLPIRFFEAWMRFVTGESGTRTDGETRNLANPGYHYRMNFPETYRCEGLKIVKFERDYRNSLEYTFIGAYPLSVGSMPVSYEGSSLLKCTVSMTYLRYVITEVTQANRTPEPAVPAQEPDKPNTQEPPVAQAKESKVQDNPGNTAGSNTEFAETDSASGFRSVDDGPLLTTRQALGLDPI